MLFSTDMVPAPIVIKLPVQTKRLVAAATGDSTTPQRKPVIVEQRSNVVTLYDNKIAERTPIEELKAGRHKLPVWADGLFEVTPVGQPRRRRKLTHLTQEEKILRRKLKNRVAAQNARNKKRSESEGLKSDNDDLRALVEQLREERIQQQYENDALRTENNILRKRLGIKTEDDEMVRTPSNVNDSFELHPMDTEIELTPSEPKSELLVLPVKDVDSNHSDSGSSPEVRVGLKVDPDQTDSTRCPASRPNLMIRIESA
jgi:regulator of replication initiation timing